MNFRALHVRLIFWYSAMVVLVVLAIGAFTYRSVEHRLAQEMVETLTRRADAINANILHTTPPLTAQAIARQIGAVYSPEANSRFIRILKQDGTALYVSGTPKDELFNPANIPVPTHPSLSREVRHEPLPSGVALLIVSVPQQVNGENWIIEMGAPTDQINTAVHELLITLMMSLPILVLVAAAGGYLLVRRSLKPVENIRATAEKITFGNLSNRLPVAATGDALEHLSLTLNQMLERLEAAYHQASRFSADASHELRTPLTIMRTELESIVQEPGLAENIRERIGSVLEETEHMSHMAEGLFAISRLDAGEAKMQHERLDLAELVSSTAEQMQLLADEKKMAIDIDANTVVTVEGDQTRLKQVVVNLLDNAIKYTPRGGSVSIQVFSFGTKATLEIQDNGEGIPQDALPHVFDRFYRADKVRSREAGGAGLGLSIVRSIVLAHGGTVELQSTEGKGATCKVELPLATKQEKESDHA